MEKGKILKKYTTMWTMASVQRGTCTKRQGNRRGHNPRDGFKMDEGTAEQANKELPKLQFLHYTVSEVRTPKST